MKKQRGRCDNGSRVELWFDAVTRFEDERDAGSVNIGKNKEIDSPLVLQEGIEPCGHVHFTLLRHTSDL